MKKIFAGIVLALALVTSAAADIKYTSPADGFTATYESVPTRSSTPLTDADGRPITAFITTYDNTGDTLYESVWSTDYAFTLTDKNLTDALQAAVTSAKNMLVITGPTVVTINGRTFHYAVVSKYQDAGPSITCYYANTRVGNRLYQVITAAQENTNNDAAARTFLGTVVIN